MPLDFQVIFHVIVKILHAVHVNAVDFECRRVFFRHYLFIVLGVLEESGEEVAANVFPHFPRIRLLIVNLGFQLI